MYKPLADRLRPETLEEMVGQRHLIGPDGMIRRLLKSGSIPNMIFYGPPGTGKTTLARIIAANTDRALHKLNATTAGTADIRELIGRIDTLLAPNGILLYLDEIQYFNKKQQQSLLEFTENGKITLIASTTENPYFYVYGAILSRSTVFEFKPLEPEDIEKAVDRAVKACAGDRGLEPEAEEGVLRHLAVSAMGDVRKAINGAELLCAAATEKDGKLVLTLEDARLIAQRSSSRYDRDGDSHFDLLSAFHKSLRGSDPDAAVYYLARILEGGDMLSAIRRLLCAASEDVGLAYPMCAVTVKSCVDSALQLGMPEAQLPLSQAALTIALAPKSNSASNAIYRAARDVKDGKLGEIPAHLRDSHYSGAEKLGRGLTYKYPHDYKDNYVSQQYLPDAAANARYYEPGENKNERSYWEYWQKIKEKNHD